MSADEKGFLARWSTRKRDAARNDAASSDEDATRAPADTTVRQAPAAETTADETAPAFDLAKLPKLEELTAETDLTVFFQKGVPESIRNAALRKSWALDPAVRNYVNPALDYAYDWNTPGGVPGSGELPPGIDIARMVAQVMGQTGSQQPPQPESATELDASRSEDVHPTDEPPPSVRLSNVTPRDEHDTALSTVDASKVQEQADMQEAMTDDASQQMHRRHGSARPR